MDSRHESSDIDEQYARCSAAFCGHFKDLTRKKVSDPQD